MEFPDAYLPACPYCPKTRLYAWGSRRSGSPRRLVSCCSRISGQIAAHPRSCRGEPCSVLPHLSGRLDQPHQQDVYRIPPKRRLRSSGAIGQKAQVNDASAAGGRQGQETRAGRAQASGRHCHPRTLLAWHQRLVARKYDGSGKRSPGRPEGCGKSSCWLQNCAAV